jgi:hypothetical protein
MRKSVVSKKVNHRVTESTEKTNREIGWERVRKTWRLRCKRMRKSNWAWVSHSVTESAEKD